MRMMVSLVLFLGVVVPGQTQVYDKVLLPVVVDAPVAGAHGSLWDTRIIGFNAGATPVEMSVLVGDACGICSFELQPGESREDLVETSASGAGVYLWIEEGRLGDVWFSYHVQDLSRQALTWGTELPVVKEEDLFTSEDSIVFPAVPVGERFRQALRIFDFDGDQNHRVLVRVFDIESGEMLAEREYTLDRPVNSSSMVAGSVQIPWLVNEFPQLRSFERVRVTITGVTPHLRFWGFFSVTNNETQHVTTLTPR